MLLYTSFLDGPFGSVAPAAPLDGLSGLTGAWSFSRPLLTAYEGTLFDADQSDLISAVYDQSGNEHDLVQSTTGNKPLAATAGPNARECAHFDGSNDVLAADGTVLSDFISNTTGYMIASCVFDDLTQNSSNPWTNHGVICEHAGYIGIMGKVDTIQVWNYDGSADVVEIVGETDTPYVIEWRHEGGQIYGRVNGGSWSNVASGNTASMTGVLRLGTRASVGSCINGKIFEAAVFSTVPSEIQRNALVANMMAWIGA